MRLRDFTRASQRRNVRSRKNGVNYREQFPKREHSSDIPQCEGPQIVLQRGHSSSNLPPTRGSSNIHQSSYSARIPRIMYSSNARIPPIFPRCEDSSNIPSTGGGFLQYSSNVRIPRNISPLRGGESANVPPLFRTLNSEVIFSVKCLSHFEY
jgi:hypothetical protein